MLLRKFEMPWRQCYEAYSVLVWSACVIAMAWIYLRAPIPNTPFLVLTGVSAGFLAWNMFGAYRVWRLKFNLGGKGISFITDDALRRKLARRPDYMWIGHGFEWTDVHTQRLYEMKRADPATLYPPRWVMRLKAFATGERVGALDPKTIGQPWIHGLDPREVDLYEPSDNWIGNTILVGVPRCGKTRFLELVAASAIELGDCVIVVDPKGDQPFELTIRNACERSGRAVDYVRFHLAFPGESVRIDPLRNYTHPSDLASRIATLMPGGDKNSSFRDFAWGVLNAIIAGMLELDEKPTLLRVRAYIDHGVADLLTRVVLAFFDRVLPTNWEREVTLFAKAALKQRGKQDEGEILVRQSLNLLLAYYGDTVQQMGLRNEAVQALSTIYRHDSAHYSKMIANLVPILGMLTTGELGPLLSPDARDVTDPRPMTDLQSIIHSGAVAYIGLNSLANKTISSAVGSVLLSDATSVAAALYNFVPPDAPRRRVWLIVDESHEVVNDPYIAMLNKSAGAGFVNVAAMQTMSDLAARFESMDKARMMLGNFNNLYAMRTKDRVTQDWVVETFGEAYIQQKQVIMGSSTNTENNLSHFTGSIQERVTETLADKLPPDILGDLCNWQYIASVSGGRIVKGRLDILTHV
jgi:conjugal transfer pilus assembly protein TraD